MDVAKLRSMIADDRTAGAVPFLIVATAGTTGAGIIDPISELADVAADAGVWLHVGAARGAAAGACRVNR